MMARLVFSGIGDLLRRPWSTLASLTAVAATVLLCGIIALGATALDDALSQGQGRLHFQVYWKPGVNPALVARQWDWMRALPGVTEARPFTPEAALALMQSSLGPQAGEVFAKGDNPLPYTMLLAFKPPVADTGFAEDMYKRLSAVEGVAEVRFNPLAVDAARRLGTLTERLGPPLGLVLVLLVGLVVGTTVRLSLAARREELEILRLVGATEWYIRIPLAIGSGVVGLAGGALAMILLKALHGVLAGVLDLPPHFASLPFLPDNVVVACVAGTGLVAALAGFVAALEPRS